MKPKNLTSSSPAAIYANPFARKILHSVPVSQVLARTLGPRHCGQAVGRLLRPFVRPDELNVLAVGRELFFKDTAQIEKRTGIHFIPWRSGHLGRLQETWTPKEFRKQGTALSEPGSENHPGWKKGEELFRSLHETLGTKDVPVIMSANTDYWQETAMRNYCTDHGVAHLVLCRENLIIPHYRNIVIDRQRRSGLKFHGHVAVFSNHMKEVFLEGGSCREDQITVTGAPRTDIWQDERPAVEKDTVLLLSFRTSLCPEMFHEAIDLFIETARQFPELRFVVKCKEGRGDYAWMRKKLKETGAPPNVLPEQYGDLRSLMERSRLIIGFNTLALTEALLTDASLIVPAWHDTEQFRAKLMMDPGDQELQEEIRFCTSAAQFGGRIQEALRAEINTGPGPPPETDEPLHALYPRRNLLPPRRRPDQSTR
jgi:hypothetical protein